MNAPIYLKAFEFEKMGQMGNPVLKAGGR